MQLAHVSYFTVVICCLHYTFFYRLRAFITCVEADQPPCRRRRISCSWGSYGGSPRRNSKEAEPRGSREFTTVATQIAKDCRRQPPHSHLRPPPTGTPVNIRIHLIFPETRVIGLQFCRCMLFKFVQWAPNDASFLRRIAFWPFKVVQGHPRSMILVPVESAYTTSY